MILVSVFSGFLIKTPDWRHALVSLESPDKMASGWLWYMNVYFETLSSRERLKLNFLLRYSGVNSASSSSIGVTILELDVTREVCSGISGTSSVITEGWDLFFCLEIGSGVCRLEVVSSFSSRSQTQPWFWQFTHESLRDPSVTLSHLTRFKRQFWQQWKARFLVI